MMPYERRQNTDNYHVRIERVITRGEDLLERIQLGAINTFEELTTAFNNTSDWLIASYREIKQIYTDPAVQGALDNRINVDLENDSHATVIDGLRSAIEQRIGALNEIRRQTRIREKTIDSRL